MSKEVVSKSDKIILFYSSKCAYCKKVMSRISSNNLRSIFLQIPVDSKYNIPNFIDRVPTIYLPSSNEILIDENVSKFVDKMISDNGTETLLTMSDVTKGITNSFSFIDESNEIGSSMFNAISDIDEHAPLMNQVNDDNDKGKFDESQYDAYISNRDNDVAQFFPRRNNVV